MKSVAGLLTLINSGKLNFAALMKLLEVYSEHEEISVAIAEKIDFSNITEAKVVEFCDSNFLPVSSDKANTILAKKICQNLDWSKFTSYHELLSFGKKLPTSGIIASLIWAELCTHFDWKKMNLDQKIEVGKTGDWHEVWGEVAKHIDWQKLDKWKMFAISEVANGRGVNLHIVRSGKLTPDEMFQMISDDESRPVKEYVATMDWQSLPVDSMLKIACLLDEEPSVWDTISAYIPA